MYILYSPRSYSGITSMLHMKLGDKRFAKTVPKWTELKLVFFSQGSLSLNLKEWFAGKSCTWQKSFRSSQILQLAVSNIRFLCLHSRCTTHYRSLDSLLLDRGRCRHKKRINVCQKLDQIEKGPDDSISLLEFEIDVTLHHKEMKICPLSQASSILVLSPSSKYVLFHWFY